MPNVEHSALADSELHEPKGISTADQGQFYVANGVGSGSWKFIPTGWAYYQDSSAAQTFGTTAARLSINGTGSLTNNTQLPYEIRNTNDELWDVSADKITPMRLGDAYDIRVDLPITSKSGSPSELTVAYDISGLGSPTIVILRNFFNVAKTPPFTMSFNMPLVALTQTTVDNGVQMFLSTDTGSVSVTNPSITVVRNHAGDI